MSRSALLDVNVLIALFDSGHVHHDAAHDWFADNHTAGWATCPLTCLPAGAGGSHGGTLVTFDASIPLKVVKDATTETLTIIAPA